jgi:hypothetical protein
VSSAGRRRVRAPGATESPSSTAFFFWIWVHAAAKLSLPPRAFPPPGAFVSSRFWSSRVESTRPIFPVVEQCGCGSGETAVLTASLSLSLCVCLCASVASARFFGVCAPSDCRCFCRRPTQHPFNPNRRADGQLQPHSLHPPQPLPLPHTLSLEPFAAATTSSSSDHHILGITTPVVHQRLLQRPPSLPPALVLSKAPRTRSSTSPRLRGSCMARIAR